LPAEELSFGQQEKTMVDSDQTGIASTYAKMRAPRYVQVASTLRRRIQEGHWAVGDKIATLEVLENEFNVARVTVRQAIELLQDEGMLKSHQGKGTFVMRVPENNRWLHLATDWDSLIDLISANIPKFLAVDTQQEPVINPEDGRAAEAYEFFRSVQMRDKEPYALASIHVAKHIYDRDPLAFQKRVALAVINDMEGLIIARAHQDLLISAADVETAIHLNIPLNAPTAEAHCIVTDADGVVIYSGDIIYPGDRVKLNIELLNSSA
jgi:GntR family transcriptional regulator